MNLSDKNLPDTEHLFTQPEPWETWERKLVWGSIITAIVLLGILGIIINYFLLK